MIKKILLTFVFSLLATISCLAATQLSPNYDSWNNLSNIKKLQNSKFNNDFYQLVNFYQPQENPLFCAIASTTIIKNALNYNNIPSQKTGERKTPNNELIAYKLYSQSDFFNDESEKIKKRTIVEYKEPKADDLKKYDPGLTLDEFATILPKAHNLNVEITKVEKNDLSEMEKFRQILKNVLNENEKFVVVNFDGKLIEKGTRGHFSPIVAYDEESDEVMVMDVALHKNQWYWVGLGKIFSAMNSKDGNSYRGYSIISQKNHK